MSIRFWSTFVFAILFCSTAAIALPVTIDQVQVDGIRIDPSSTNEVRVLDRGNKLDVVVELTSQADVEDAQVEVSLRGFDHDDLIEDITDVFDLRGNRTVVKRLTLTLPDRLEKDQYRLRVRIDNRAGDTTSQTYELEIENKRHDVSIRDVVFSPSSEVVAGRSLITILRLRNLGMVNEDDGVKVTVRIPDLGISATDFIDEIEEDESVTSEELFLRIPACAETGIYDIIVTAEFDDGDEFARITDKIRVVHDESACPTEQPQQQGPTTTIGIGLTSMDVRIGEAGAVYQMTLANSGATAKTYVISATGFQSFADVRISPANIVVLQPGEQKAIFIAVTAREDAQLGQHTFGVSVESGGETLRSFTFTSNVLPASAPPKDTSNIRNILLVGLVILVILLIILGLIIGFGKLKGNGKNEYNEEKDESGQTYY